MKKEELIKFYHTYKLYIFPAVVALSSIFLIFFAILPQTMKLLENQKVEDSLIKQVDFLESKVLALESISDQDLSYQVELTLKSFPQDKDLGVVLGLLQGLVTESGFNIASISFGDSEGKLGSSNSFEVKLELRGTKILFPSLLNNLENSPRLVRVNSFDISNNQASGTFDVSLALEVLYSPLPGSFGGLDAPLPEMTTKDQEVLAKLAKTATTPAISVGPLSPRGRSNPFE